MSAPAAAPATTSTSGSTIAANSNATAASSSATSAASAASTKKRGRKRKTTTPTLRNSISIALVCQSNLNRSMEAHWILQEKGNIRSYSFGAGSKVRLPGETIDRPHVYEFGTTYDVMYKDLERKNRSRYTKNGMLQMLDRDRQLKDAPERWQDHYERYQNDAALRAKKTKAEAAASSSSSSSAAAISASSDEPIKPRHFDIVITYEKRVYDIVQADIEARGSNAQLSMNQPTHLLNIDTTDNHAEAAISANLTLELVEAIYKYVKKRSGEEDDAVGEGDDSDEVEETKEDDAAAADDDEDDDGEDWVDKIDEIIDEFEKKHGKEVGHTVIFY